AAELNHEVAALRILYYLKTTPEQARAIQKFAKETASPAKPRKAKASANYRQLLADLRDALGEDEEERVTELEDKLDKLSRKEKPEFEEEVEITAAARKRAPEVLRLLKPSQVASYVGSYADDIGDPRDELLDALGVVRTWKLEEWKEQRDTLGKE